MTGLLKGQSVCNNRKFLKEVPRETFYKKLPLAGLQILFMIRSHSVPPLLAGILEITLIFQDLEYPGFPASGNVDRMGQRAIVTSSSECGLAFGQASIDLSNETDWSLACSSKES